MEGEARVGGRRGGPTEEGVGGRAVQSGEGAMGTREQAAEGVVRREARVGEGPRGVGWRVGAQGGSAASRAAERSVGGTQFARRGAIGAGETGELPTGAFG